MVQPHVAVEQVGSYIAEECWRSPSVLSVTLQILAHVQPHSHCTIAPAASEYEALMLFNFALQVASFTLEATR